MKKAFFASICIASFALIGCGDPCADLAEAQRECCAQLTDEAAKTLCNQVADAVEENGDSDACQTALDNGGDQCATAQ